MKHVDEAAQFETAFLKRHPNASRTLLNSAWRRTALELGGSPNPVIAWARHLAGACAESGLDPDTFLGSANLEDLAWAFRCLRNEPRALQRLDALLRQCTHDPETAQRLRIKLLVPTNHGAAKLASYQGRSQLASWLKVVASRDARAHLDAGVPGPEWTDVANALLTNPESPEQFQLEKEQRLQLHQVLSEAIAQLDARARLILRLRYEDGLTLEEVAQVSGWNRATVVRALNQLRTHLLRQTRENLKQKLRVHSSTLDSFLRGIVQPHPYPAFSSPPKETP